ncbi:MAG: GNAT family N-acetyltransferase [Rhodobacteraceae bacterium]|nr:GNAT family N-acetyltransferase [Paracoccaceae bacterium]
MTDAATLNTLHSAAFGHAEAHGWRRDDFAKALEDEGHVIVATAKGYALARVLLDEAELLLIATLPNARRSGEGTALLKELFEQLAERQVARVFLEVVETNEAALALYRRHGFSVSGHRHNYYGRGAGHGAVLMEKALK